MEQEQGNEFAVTPGQAARLLGLTAWMVRKYCDSGYIQCTLTEGKHRRISLKELRRVRRKMNLHNSWNLPVPRAK